MFTGSSELSGTEVVSTENHMLLYLHYKQQSLLIQEIGMPEEEDIVRWLLKSPPKDPEATWKALEKAEL